MTRWQYRLADQYDFRGDKVVAYRAIELERVEGVLRNGFPDQQYFTTDIDRAVFYANFVNEQRPGAIFECHLDSSRNVADMNDATREQSSESYDHIRSATYDIVDAITSAGFEITESVIEQFIGSQVGADIAGHYDTPSQPSIWLLISEHSGITPREARELVPPGYYGGYIVLDRSGVFGVNDEVPSAQVQYDYSVPANHIVSIYLHSSLVNNVGWQYQNSLYDSVNVIPAQLEELHQSIGEQLSAISDDDAGSELYEFLTRLYRDINDEMGSFDDERGTVNIPGNIYRKLRSGEIITENDIENADGFVKFEMPKDQMRVLYLIRRTLGRKVAAVFPDGNYGGPAFNIDTFQDEYQRGDYLESKQIYDDASYELELQGYSNDLIWFRDSVDPSVFASGLTVENCWTEDYNSGIDNFQELVDWLQEVDDFEFEEADLAGYDRTKMSSIKQLMWEWDFDAVGDEWDDWGPYKWVPDGGEWARCRSIARDYQEYPVNVLYNGKMIDGAHRLAVALYKRERSHPALVGVPESMFRTASYKSAQQEPQTGSPFTMTGFHATTADFDTFAIPDETRTPKPDLTASGVFFYGDRFDAERLHLDGDRRIIEATLTFQNPFVFRKYPELYQYVGVDYRDPQKSQQVTAALTSKGHDGFIKLYQTKAGIDEVVVFSPSQIQTQTPMTASTGHWKVVFSSPNWEPHQIWDNINWAFQALQHPMGEYKLFDSIRGHAQYYYNEQKQTTASVILTTTTYVNDDYKTFSKRINGLLSVSDKHGNQKEQREEWPLEHYKHVPRDVVEIVYSMTGGFDNDDKEPEMDPTSDPSLSLEPVYAAWYDDDEMAVIDPTEVGYDESWGEHHGPVSIKPDRWNYGPKGYGYPPMPLPKKLYHATPYPDEILNQGFKVPKELGHQSFGGGDAYMSFTTLENAKRYQEVLKDLVQVAQGKFDNMTVEEAFRYLGDKWNAPSESVDRLLQMVNGWLEDARTHGKDASMQRALLWFFGYAHNFSGIDIPFLFGADQKVLERLKGKRPEDIGIVEVETVPAKYHSGANIFDDTDMSNNYTYNKSENEWRFFDPKNVRPIRRVASSSGNRIVYHSKTKGDFTDVSTDIGSDADIFGKGFYFGDVEYASRYGDPEPYTVDGLFATTEQWMESLAQFKNDDIKTQRQKARELLRSAGYCGVDGGNVGVVWDADCVRKAENTTNWNYKFSQQERGVSFTLMGDRLEWYHGYHTSFLQYKYNLPGGCASLLRWYLPRGASVEDIEDGHIVEGSEELRPYATEIAERLNISPMRIGFSNDHYEVRTDVEWPLDVLEAHFLYDDESVVQNIMKFLGTYLPNIYNAVVTKFPDIVHQKVASAGHYKSIPPILWGLVAEARKYATFEEFSKAYLVQIKHGMYWHVTDDPNFFIDPTRGPRDMSSMSTSHSVSAGKLMITSHLSYWAGGYAPHRRYAALIDMSEVPENVYRQVNRGMGNEFFVQDPSKAKVIGVFNIKDALRIDEEHKNKLPGSDAELMEFWQEAQNSEIPPMTSESLQNHFESLTPDQWNKSWDEEWAEYFDDGQNLRTAATMPTNRVLNHVQQAIINYLDGDWQVIKHSQMSTIKLQRFDIIEMTGRNVKLEGDQYYVKVFCELRRDNSGQQTISYDSGIGHQLLSFRGFIEGWKGPNGPQHEVEERLFATDPEDVRSKMVRIGEFGSTIAGDDESGIRFEESHPTDTPFAVADYIRNSIDRFWQFGNDDGNDDQDSNQPYQPDPSGEYVQNTQLVTAAGPRVFYRGTTPGDMRRIDEPFDAARGKTFVARQPESARMYGESIEEITARSHAKILYEEDPEFWRLLKRRRPPNSSIKSVPGGLIENVNLIIQRATEEGFDAVSFSSDSDIGTVILNELAFSRNKMASKTVRAEFYHGTTNDAAHSIMENGFQVSTSGGGQRGLMGVWLTEDIETAKIYSKSVTHSSRPVLLNVAVEPGLRFADFVSISTGRQRDDWKAQWALVGIDIENPEDQAKVGSLQPYAMTKLLREQGYDGAWIPNTLAKVSSPELVVFDPAKLRITSSHIESSAQRWTYKFARTGPLVVYHATVAGRAIMSEGFKTSKELGGTAALGGSDYRGSISFTTDYDVALGVFNGLVMMHEFATSPDPLALARQIMQDAPAGMLDQMTKAHGGPGVQYLLDGFTLGRWSDVDKPLTPDELTAQGFRPLPTADLVEGRYYYWLRPMSKDELDYFVYQFVKYYLSLHPDLYDPLFFGSDINNFRKIDRQDIGIVTVELEIDPTRRRDRGTGGGDGFDYLTGMGEVQITDKSMIKRILDFDSNPGQTPKVQADPVAYHTDPQIEEKLNQILPVLYKNYQALKQVFADPSVAIMLLRQAKDMYRIEQVVYELKKSVNWLMFSDVARIRRYFEMDDDTKAGFEVQTPEVQKAILEATDDADVGDIIWRLMDAGGDEYYEQLEQAGVRNPDRWRRNLIDWKQQQITYLPKYKQEMESVKRSAPHVNDQNILALDEVGKALSRIFPSRYAQTVWNIKYGQLDGEWFLDDSGYASFADGDVGDYNHEALALQSKIPDELWERYDNMQLTDDEILEIGQDFLTHMWSGGEAREWMVMHEGWIRIKGANFELNKLDANAINRISNFLGEQLYDEDPNEVFIYVEETSTGNTAEFSAQQIHDASDDPQAMARLIMIMRGNRFAKSKRVVKTSNNYVYEDDEGWVKDPSGKTFWGSRGAGVLLVRNHPQYGKQFLSSLRGPSVAEGNTWGITGGGAVLPGADDFETAIRETEEELGPLPQYNVVGSYLWKAPGGNFQFRTFILETIDPNWEPQNLNSYEVSDAVWTNASGLSQRDVHFGLQDLVNDLGESLYQKQAARKTAFTGNQAFFLIDGRLIFIGEESHSTWLHENYGLTPGESNAARYLLQRGRASKVSFGNVLIEASPELQNYKEQLIDALEISALDRPIWVFNDKHYWIDIEYASNILDNELKYQPGGLSREGEKFFEKYAPNLLAMEK